MNKTREQIIHSMCGTWRHDYGLMDEQSKNSLFRSMAQIFDNDISAELIMQSDCDNYEEELEQMRDKIDSLEEQNQGLQSLLDLKQQEISVLESQVEEEAKQAYIQGSKDSHEAWKKTLKKNFGIEL